MPPIHRGYAREEISGPLDSEVLQDKGEFSVHNRHSNDLQWSNNSTTTPIHLLLFK